MVAAIALHQASRSLADVAGTIESAATRHEAIAVQIGSAVTAAGVSWTSPAAKRFVADGRSLASAASRLPSRLGIAADRTRQLVATTASLAEELGGCERARASAVGTVEEAVRRRSWADPADVATLQNLAEQQRAGMRAQRSAEQAIDDCVRRWEAACRDTAVVVGAAANQIRAHGPAGGFTDGRTSGFGRSPLGHAISWTERIVTSTVASVAIAGHAAVLMGQRVAALGEMTRAWLRRGWYQATATPRAIGTVVGRIATLRWFGTVAAARNSLAASATRIAAQSARISRAAEVFRSGRGVIRVAGRWLAPVAVLADASVLIRGSDYDGGRGTADRIMAGVGIVAGVTLIAAAFVVASPVVVTAAIVGATAAAVWGIGNLIYDHREAIGDFAASAARTVAVSATQAANTAVEGATRVARVAAEGADRLASATVTGLEAVGTGIVDGATSVAAGVGGGVGSAASAIGSGASSAGRSVGRFLGFGG